MSEDATAMTPATTRTLGDRIRNVTHQLRQERDLQIKATSRILGAAAQLAINHDRLLDEVVEMVETDLHSQNTDCLPMYTVDALKHQFKTLKRATAHFNLKAHRWEALVTQLNAANAAAAHRSDPSAHVPSTDASIGDRLTQIEQAIQTMQTDIHHIHKLLIAIAETLDHQD